MNQRLIVTGGAGFIGSNLVRELNARGHRNILVVDNLDSHPAKKKNLDGTAYADYLDKKEFRKRFLSRRAEPASAVFHIGACSSTTEMDEHYLTDNNFLYTRQLCEWCLAGNVRFIYASSAATYGDGSLGYSDDDRLTPRLQPLNPYGRSKQMFDLWALENRVLDRIAGIKYFNVYGPREDHKGDMRSVVNKAYAQILATGKLGLFKSYRPDFKDGEQDRDFIYVRDAVAVTLFFMDRPDVSGLFNAGTGAARTWLDLGRAIFSALGRAPAIHFIEMPDLLRDKYQYHTQADVSKLRSAGYVSPFTSIEDGVKDYVTSYLAKQST